MTAVVMTSAEAAERRGLFRIMAGLAPISLAVQLCSFVSSVALARVLGATYATDAYFLALSIPTLVYGILLAAVRVGATPALSKVARDAEPGAFDRAASELVAATMVTSAIVALAAGLLAVAFLPAAAGAAEPHMVFTIRLMILELTPLGVFGALSGAFAAILGVRGVFAPAVAVMLIEPMLKAALTVLLGQTIGAQTLVLGNVVGSGLASVVLWRCVQRSGIRLSMASPRRSALVRDVVALSLPLIVSQSVLQVNPIVDRTMAGGLGAGSVTTLEMGLRLFVVPTSLLTATLIGPITASWAATKLAEGWSGLRASVDRALHAAAVILPPLLVLGVMLRGDLIAFVYRGGAYTPAALHGTTSVFGALVFALPAMTLTIVFSTLFIVHAETVFPMKVGIANVVVNAVLNVLLRDAWGIAGIAASTSATLTVLLAVYARAAHKRWGRYAEGAGPAALRVIASSAVLVGTVAALLDVLPAPLTRIDIAVRLTCASTAAITAYLVALVILRDPMLTAARQRLRPVASGAA